MSRLHIALASRADIAAHFAAEAAAGIEVPDETMEGCRGLVVFELGGRRRLRSPSWGFPRLTRDMRERGDGPGRIAPVADLTNPMWEHLVVEPHYRCLIALTRFADPDGDPGEKTRTWFSLKDQPIMAWAGFVRPTPEFGPVNASITIEANAAVAPTNDRMPVILKLADYDCWLRGPIQEGRPIAADRMIVKPTEDRWRSGKPPIPQQSELLRGC